MKILLFILYFCIFISIEVIASEDFSEKIIISLSTNDAQEEETLLRLKMYFIEDPILRNIEEKYHLLTTIDVVENYKIVVIKPLPSREIRNQLLLILVPMFPDIFSVDTPLMKKVLLSPRDKQVDMSLTKESVDKRKASTVFEGIELQWLAIWALAVMGLLLSLWNRRKLSNLNQTQKDISANQNKIEKEIKHLGVQNV